jgi:hypothetical protein
LTHQSSGFYGGNFSSDDANTLGTMDAYVHVAGALLLKQSFNVVTANDYGSMMSTVYKSVNTASISSGAISSAAISSGALYSSAHILSSAAFSSGWISSLSFNTGAISSQALSSGAISTLTISTAAWDQSAASVWSALRSAYVSTLTMGYTQSTLFTLSSLSYSSGWLSSLAFGLSAISSAAISSGAISTLQISTAAWDQAANSVWTAARASYVSTLTMGYTQSTLNWTNISNETWANSTKTLSSGDAVWSAATRTLTDYSSVILSTAGRDAVVDAMWDELRSDHISTASMGYTQSTSYSISASISTTNYDEISSVTWANATRTLSTSQVFDLTGTITGNLSGIVGSISSMSTSIINSIFGFYVESTITVKDALIDIHAESVGASTGGGGSTAVFYSPNSSVARITATVSSEGNRNAPTFNRT